MSIPIKEAITNVIKQLGIPAHIKGYRYVRYAIELVINDMELSSEITKTLYPEVAKEFNATPTSVERAIRNAIEVGWCRADIDFAHMLFGYSLDVDRGKPTNSEFIATIADYIIIMQRDIAKEEQDGHEV